MSITKDQLMELINEEVSKLEEAEALPAGFRSRTGRGAQRPSVGAYPAYQPGAGPNPAPSYPGEAAEEKPKTGSLGQQAKEQAASGGARQIVQQIMQAVFAMPKMKPLIDQALKNRQAKGELIAQLLSQIAGIQSWDDLYRERSYVHRGLQQGAEAAAGQKVGGGGAEAPQRVSQISPAAREGETASPYGGESEAEARIKWGDESGKVADTRGGRYKQRAKNVFGKYFGHMEESEIHEFLQLLKNADQGKPLTENQKSLLKKIIRNT